VSNTLAYHGISGGKKFFRIDSKKFSVILEFIKVQFQETRNLFGNVLKQQQNFEQDSVK
jgi:helix-turn-helix protein